MNNEKFLEYIKRIKTISDLGLIYAENDYDIDRYKELQTISFEMMSMLTDKPMDILKNFYLPVKEYPTPNVDIRGFILNENKEILMVREKTDGKWSLPGGWAEIGYTPAEVIKKEVEEETGLTINVLRPLAIYDKRCHPHPPQPIYVYKIVFLCEQSGGYITTSFDISDVNYFSINNLPEISESRILKSQIEQLYQKVLMADMSVYFD
jgi:ADP-ribose pyrophosphatase YjhB (NUDIX family)